MKCVHCVAEIEADSSFCIVCGKPVSPSRQLRIGRDAGNDIVVNHDRISRLHAVITKEGSHYRITDQNSLNGILVNGQKVTSALIRPGDKVSLGGIVELDWNAVAVAFSGVKSGTRPRPAPVFYHQEASQPRKSPSALLISLIVLGVIGLLAGAYFLWDSISAGSGKSFNIQSEYSYSVKSVEDPEMASRRSEVETLEDLLARAPAVFGREMSLLLSYCLLDVKVSEPQTLRSSGTEEGKILRTASTSITEREFNARYEYLRGREDHLAMISEAENQLAQARAELKLREAELSLASKAPEGRDLINQGIGAINVLAKKGDKPPLDSLKDNRIDSSVNQALRDYDEALGNLEGVYASLNDIKAEVAAVKADSSKKGGRVLK